MRNITYLITWSILELLLVKIILFKVILLQLEHILFIIDASGIFKQVTYI